MKNPDDKDKVTQTIETVSSQADLIGFLRRNNIKESQITDEGEVLDKKVRVRVRLSLEGGSGESRTINGILADVSRPGFTIVNGAAIIAINYGERHDGKRDKVQIELLH